MDEIVNPRTGQRMVFITDTPEVLEIDTVNPPTPVAEPEHVHPRQTSGARVISGVLKFDVAGQRRALSAGESITIPPDVPHHFWNPGHEDAHAVQWFRPALKSRLFFETLFALARDGKLDDAGMPGMLQIAAMIPVFGDEIRPTRPPWVVQRTVAAVLGPVARVRGYRGVYVSDAAA